MTIGIFDSGIGGLTVARALLDRLPGHDLVYVGATAPFPRGAADPESAAAFAEKHIRFLVDQGAALVVLACTTVGSLALDPLTRRFGIPVLETITPAADAAVKASRGSVIGIIGTRAAIAGAAHENAIRKQCPTARVYTRACPLLVPLVEEGWIRRPETVMIVKKYLHPLKVRQVDTLVLGCAHFTLLKDTIQRKIGRRVRLVDPAQAVAHRAEDILRSDPRPDPGMQEKPRVRVFVSDVSGTAETLARNILRGPVRLENIR